MTMSVRPQSRPWTWQQVLSTVLLTLFASLGLAYQFIFWGLPSWTSLLALALAYASVEWLRSADRRARR